METIVIVVHVLASIAIIGLILLQQGKGAEMGASFGAGASNTLFGSQGGGSFFSRMTAFIAVVFFATSFALAVIAKEKSQVGDIGIPRVQETEVEVPEVEQAQPQNEVPTVETPEPAAEVPAVEQETVPAEGDEVPGPAE
ncbi:preprotein translocase subunit SecG [Proteobacteria bacterium 005FR1]|nr:preprotein translocase subunit SecG [Proteobacteria bacterium 005FR1]